MGEIPGSHKSVFASAEVRQLRSVASFLGLGPFLTVTEIRRERDSQRQYYALLHLSRTSGTDVVFVVRDGASGWARAFESLVSDCQ